MSRILAIDYGLKRTGIAVTDPGKLIATALDTIQSHKVIEYLKKYLAEESVECFVVGEPRQMNYSPSEITPQIDEFIKRLKITFPSIPVKRMDERFTSRMAMQSMIMSGLKKSDRRKKELVDQVSAVIILQSFMEMYKPE